MNSRDRAALDDRGKGGSVRVVETRRLSRSLPVDQTRRTIGVELEHPIANDLKRHPANPGRLRPTGSLINRRQRRSRRACGPSLLFLAQQRTPTASKSARSGTAMANLLRSPPNQTLANSEIPSPKSRSPGFGIELEQMSTDHRGALRGRCFIARGADTCCAPLVTGSDFKD